MEDEFDYSEKTRRDLYLRGWNVATRLNEQPLREGVYKSKEHRARLYYENALYTAVKGEILACRYLALGECHAWESSGLVL